MVAPAAVAPVTTTQAALTLHVDTIPSRTASRRCVFVIRNRLVERGRQTTCLTAVDGFPAPDGVIHSRGTMSFSLRRGTIRVRVAITMRFAGDGVHATQTVRGRVVGGSRAYRDARGSMTGRGSVADRASGLGRVRVRYRIVLRH